MMRKLLGIFGQGLVALLPIFLSVYIIVRFFRWADETVHSLLSMFLPDDFYIPGMGIVFGISFIFLLGLSLSNYFGSRARDKLDRIFRRVPLIKTFYTAIHDLTEYFSPEKSGGNDNQVVVVKFPDSNVQAIGLVTRRDLSDLPDGLDKEGRVAVFFPMSYQVGGFTLFLPKLWLTPLDMKVESLMRSAVTGWMKKKST